MTCCPGISKHISCLLAAALILVAALAAGFYLGQNASTVTGVPKFEGMLGNKEVAAQFPEFITANDGSIVYLDVWVDDSLVVSSDVPAVFTVYEDCGLDIGCSGNEYLVYLNDGADAMFSHSARNGGYALKGYWSVMANTALNQGVFSNVLKAKELNVVIDR